MYFSDFFSFIGTALVVAVCVLIMKNPIHLEEAPVVTQLAPPSPITKSPSAEPQAPQLVASPSTKKLSRVEELIGSVEATATSPLRKRSPMAMAFISHKEQRRSIYECPSVQPFKAVPLCSSVAGARQTTTITSTVTITTDTEMTDVAPVYAGISEVISVEVEMMDAPDMPLKSCFKTNSARKSVSFAGPSSDRIRGRIAFYEVSEMKSFHEKYMAQRQAPHVSFPLIQETDLEGNANGWFVKRDSVCYPPTAPNVLPKEDHHLCKVCRGNLSTGFLDPVVDYPEAVLEADDPGKAIEEFVQLDQKRRYHCRSHGGY